jgi:fructose-1,6-bisphosphatase/inositol monophosphatase family enzyme
MDVARGKLHFSAYGGRLKPWDHAAGVLLHREAGGYSAFFGDGSAYRPESGIVRGRLLLAPDRDGWAELHGFLDG